MLRILEIWLFATLLLALPSLASPQRDHLFPVHNVEYGDNSNDAICTDLDQDGFADVIVVPYNNISCWLNFGRPGVGFDMTEIYNAKFMSCVDVGDLNGDQIPDLFFGCSDFDGYGVTLGLGNRQFSSSVLTGIAGYAQDVCLADLDADGFNDALLATQTGMAVHVLHGLGTGSFTHVGTVSLTEDAGAIDAGDLNGDGLADLVAASRHGGIVEVFLNAGGLGFTAAGSHVVGDGHEDVELVDLDGDGLLDIVSPDGVSATVSLLLSDGSGGFVSAGQHAVGGEPRSIASADLDEDGDVDLVVATGTQDNQAGIALLAGLGAANYAEVRSLHWGSTAVRVMVEDFNEDGALDILTDNIQRPYLSVLLAQGPGGFHTPTQLPVDYPVALTSGDFNGDGKADICTSVTGGLDVLLGDGSGGFATGAGLATNQVSHVYRGDFNVDGDLDVLATDWPSNVIKVYPGDGQGGFVDTVPATAVGSDPQGIVVTELNGDGAPDVVCLTDSNVLKVLFGDGTGGFSINQTFPLGSWSRALDVADIDQDGVLDIVVTGSVEGNVLLGQGGGLFGAPTVAPGLRLGRGMTLADLDGDGFLDAAFHDLDLALVCFGHGDGTFEPHFIYENIYNQNVRESGVADLDGDGANDFFVLIENFRDEGSLRVYFGPIGATLPAPVAYAIGQSAIDMVVDDFNGDGRLDVGAASLADEEVSVLLARGAEGGHGSHCVSAATSIGCVPAISSSGLPSVSGAIPFHVTVSQVVSNQFGFFIYGFAPNARPFVHGTLCVAAPQARFLLTSSGGSGPPIDCTGSFDVDFGALITGGSLPGLDLGRSVFAQFWFRDPPSTSGGATSDGLRFVIGP